MTTDEKLESVDELDVTLDLTGVEEDIEQEFTYKEKNYVVCEAKGKAAVAYRNSSLAAVVWGPDGKVQSVRNAANVEPALVAACVFEVVAGAPRKAVKEAMVLDWPSRLQRRLYDWIKKVSDLNETTPERVLLEKALNRPGAPLTLPELREYCKVLTEDEYKPLHRWLAASAEEKAKNERSDTMDGSN